MATGRFLAPLNGATLQQQIQRPYVDDIWDPLFNRDVQNYYRNTYGALGAVPMAYMDMWDNALTGQKGILGPGMGILGTFGRSMDKADDAILGTLTEGVNAIGNVLGGSNAAPQNPIRNIFVNDYNYEGTGLMAAMGNAMARLAGAPNTRLDSSDFNTLGDRSAGTILDLATDPGYSGGILARLNPNTPVGQAGQILSDYDDIMADVAGNVTLPGGKAILNKNLDNIINYMGAAKARNLTDIELDPTVPTPEEIEAFNMAVEEANKVFPEGVHPWGDSADTFKRLSQMSYVMPKPVKKTRTLQFLDDGSKDLRQIDITLDTKRKNIADSVKAMNTKRRPLFDSYIDVKQDVLPEDLIQDIDNLKDGDYFDDVLTDFENVVEKSYGDDYFKHIQGIADEQGLDSNDPRHLLYVLRERMDSMDARVAKRDNVPFYTSVSTKRVREGTAPSVTSYVGKRVQHFLKDNPEFEDLDLSKASPQVAEQITGKIYDEAFQFSPEQSFKFLESFKNKDFKETVRQNLNTGEEVIHSTGDLKIPVRTDKGIRYLSGHELSFATSGTLSVDESGRKYYTHIFTYPIGKDAAREMTESERLANIRAYAKQYNGTFSSSEAFRNAAIKFKKIPYIAQELKLYGAFDQSRVPSDLIKSIQNITNPTEASYADYLANIDKFTKTVDLYRSGLESTDLGKSLVSLSDDLKDNIITRLKVTSEDAIGKFNEYQPSPHLLEYYDFKDLPGIQASSVEQIQSYSKHLKKYPNSPWTTSNARALQKEVPDLDLMLKKGHTIFADKDYYVVNRPEYANLPEYSTFETFKGKDGVEMLKIPAWSSIPAEIWNAGLKDKIRNEALNLDYSPEQTITDNIFNINPKIKIKLKAPEKLKTIDETLGITSVTKDMNNDKFVALLNNPKTLTESKQDAIADTLFSKYKEEWGLPKDASLGDLENHIKTYGDKKTKTLFALFNKMRVAKIKASHGDYSDAVLAYKPVKETRDIVDKLIKSNKYTDKDIVDYLVYNSYLEDQVIKGDDMLKYIAGSNGKVLVTTNSDNSALRKVIQDNIAKVNAASKNGNILTIIDYKNKNGKYVLGYAFDTSNGAIKKDIHSLTGLFNKKLDLQDMTFFSKADPNLMAKYRASKGAHWDDLDNLFSKIRTTSSGLATSFGLDKNMSSNYIKWAIEDNKDQTKFFVDLDAETGLDDNSLSKVCNAIRDVNDRGSFGISRQNRMYLGGFDHYKDGFSHNLKTIHDSTFTEGFLDDTLAQSHIALFTNQNFSLKNNFKDANQVKKALYAGDGNFDNCALVSPTVDQNGRIVGYHKYNKADDADIARAFEDEDCVLIENSMLGLMDRTLKKDARMSNKVYQFLNKYFTVPFKMGTLANPGFLVGNIQDAYFKQATALAEKYGTSLEEELTEVAMSMRYTVELNNKFEKDIFTKYRNYLDNLEDPKLKKQFYETLKAHRGTGIDSRIVMNNPKYFDNWRQFMDHGGVLTDDELATAKLYTYLNCYQNTAMYNNNNLDISDVLAQQTVNKYDIPENPVERVLYGDPSAPLVKRGGQYKRKFSAMGLVVNNSYGDAILKSSNYIEDLMRTSTILNDLRHQGYSMDRIKKIIMIPEDTDAQLRQDLRIGMSNAVNTMHSANFDYDNVSPLMDKMSYILPFPTFYLKNMAFWAQQAVNKPQLIDDIISIQEGMWSGRDTKGDEFAAEAKGRGAIPIGGPSKHLTGIVKQSPYNSMFGAFNAVNNLKEDFAYRTNPLMRPVARHLQDPKDIKYRPYSTNPYEKNITKGDSKFSELAYMFHQLNPYERTINTFSRTPKKVATNDWQLSDFAPSIFQPDFSKKSGKR